MDLMSDATSTGSAPDRRWLILGVIGLGQVTVGQQLGASVGTALLSTLFATAVTSYLAAHIAAARLIGGQALTGLALAHGYDTTFWWTAGIFAAGAVIGGALLRPGPLRPAGTQSAANAEVTTAQAKADPARPG
jgi:hypothetical protein